MWISSSKVLFPYKQKTKHHWKIQQHKINNVFFHFYLPNCLGSQLPLKTLTNTKKIRFKPGFAKLLPYFRLTKIPLSEWTLHSPEYGNLLMGVMGGCTVSLSKLQCQRCYASADLIVWVMSLVSASDKQSGL